MARSLDDLDAPFRMSVEQVLAGCHARGVEMRPFYTLRTPAEQARMWRQSRATEEIEAAVARLSAGRAPYLADVLDGVGPQHGPHVTNALPGYSWHQWGLAVDCFWVVAGSAQWSPTFEVDDQNGYQVYAEEARRLGLRAGADWSDWVHAQLPQDSSPARRYSMAAIDRAMKDRFDG